MGSVQNKTLETKESVHDFIKKIEDENQRADSAQLLEVFTALLKTEPRMWGSAIIGFGSCHYVYESGREGDMPLAAFSPRKAGIVIYLCSTFSDREALLLKLGKHKTNKGCVTIKKLADIDIAVLKKMVNASFKYYKALYPQKK